MSNATPHTWQFFRAGGLDQARLETADDLRHLHELDQKLWVALSCPTKGLEFDARTLELIDTDKDGRVRAPELIAAVKWASDLLKDPADLLRGGTGLPLSAIDDSKPAGRSVRAAAERILENLGRGGVAAITVEEAADTQRIFGSTPFNGDGVLTAAGAPDDASRKVHGEILAMLGADTDRSGEPGITRAKVGAFFAELAAFDEWQRAGEALHADDATTAPWGAKFGAANAAFARVKAKVDDYFARCRLDAFDPEYAAGARARAAAATDLATLPLQRAEAGRALDLERGLNPEWAPAIAELRAAVVAPLYGESKSTLDEREWTSLAARFGACEAWLSAKKGAQAEKLGLARVREILAGSSRAALEAALAKDEALAAEYADVGSVERLARYHRDLKRLLGTFVNFAGFYDRRTPSIFQAGTLYLDQRSCDLCIRVDDPGAHAAIAGASRLYIAYCACTRPSGEKMTIAAAFTQGDSDYLQVGRNGIFYDRKGRDWDATIVKVLDNPISIRQAFWSPYKKFGRLVEAQIEKFASAKDRSVHEAASTGVSEAATKLEDAKPPQKAQAAAAPFDVAKFAGIFAAIGLAIGAIGGAIGAMVGAFAKLAWWQMPLAAAGIMLAVSGPSMLLAWLKLRQRTLGPVLEGTGWAVNGRIRVNLPLGSALTSPAKLPANSRRTLDDPFEDKETQRRTRLAYAATGAVATALLLWFVVRPFSFAPDPATAPPPPPPASASVPATP